MDRQDRDLLRVVLICVLLAAAFLAGGVLIRVWVQPPYQPAWFDPLAAGVFAALFLLVLGGVEVVRRLRHGAQQPGRHTRP